MSGTRPHLFLTIDLARAWLDVVAGNEHVMNCFTYVPDHEESRYRCALEDEEA
jgi:cation transport regulator ChaC